MRRPPLAVMVVVGGRKSSPPIVVFWIEMAGAEGEKRLRRSVRLSTKSFSYSSSNARGHSM